MKVAKEMTTVIVVALTVVMLSTAFCYAKSETPSVNIEGQEWIYNTTKEYQEKEVTRQIKEQLLEEGCTEGEIATILKNSMIVPLNDLSDYKHEYSDKVRKWVSGYAGGIPSEGLYVEYGGGFFYEPEDGPLKEISIAFGGKYGSVGFSVPLGRRTAKVSAYIANVPAKGFYKLKVENCYEFQAYIIYKKVWNDAGTYTWKKFSTGKIKTLKKVKLIPVKVS